MLELPLEPPDVTTYICPICEREIPSGTMLFYNEFGDCVGCEECITHKYVEDVYEDGY